MVRHEIHEVPEVPKDSRYVNESLSPTSTLLCLGSP